MLSLERNLTHLHVHSVYSMLDGYNNPVRAAKKAKELGMKAIAVTDHNNLGGVLDWQKACKDEGIKPILGCEMYYTHDTNTLKLDSDSRKAIATREAIKNGVVIPPKAKVSEINELIAPYMYDTKQYHIVLIAINQTGWSNLVKLQSEAATECTFNGRYCCDNALLSKYNEGIIMTTACLGNAVSNLLNSGREQEANDLLEEWKSIFGDRLYLEIQPLQQQEQYLTNWYYYTWAKEKGIGVVATTDAHYTNESDWDDHDTLLCIGIGKLKEDETRMKYLNEFWIKSYDEMIDGFERQTLAMKEIFGELIDEEEYTEFYIDALENTNTIADMIEDIKLGSDVPLLPKVTVPDGLTSEQYLTLESYKNLYKYAKENKINLREYEKRLSYELAIINKKGYADYMLIVKEYIQYCEDNNIAVGPGRGSAAGSLCLFLNGITKCIDPMKYNLLFSRFLTADRTALPDVDCDFSWSRRDEVIKHLEDIYGKLSVSHIGTYSTLGVKNGLKDVGRVLNIDFGIMNNITKKIDEITDEDPGTSFKSLDALKDGDERDSTKWKEFNNLEKEYAELFRLARTFEGIPRNMGVHASGILVTPMAVNELFPTRTLEDGTTVALYTGVQLEDLGAVKFDILGLKTLDVLDRTCRSIDPDMTVYDLYELINQNLNDKEVFDNICNKEVDGLFQIESNLFKGLIDDIMPENINDIIFLTSVARPGPLGANMHKIYAENKKSGKINEPLPGTHSILEDAYDTIVYQEHVMLIAKLVAKVDDNQADSLFRKAIAKKKADLMEICRRVFIYGKVNAEDPDPTNVNAPYYDKKGKYGPEVLGGINNGYDEKALTIFFENLRGYASYLFNKSHAACYSFITDCTGYLKTYYPAKFMAALLSMQDVQLKIDQYIKVSRAMDIAVKAPDINLSQFDFAEVNGDILYGLAAIKGVGKPSAEAIIEARPFTSLEGTIETVGKKKFNKRVGVALIKAGAFEVFEPNRNKLVNSFYDIRGDKDDRLDESAYDEDLCIVYEKEVLGSSITYIPQWEMIQTGEIVEVDIRLKSVQEKIDKRGNMMAFVTGLILGSEVRAVCFSSTYTKNVDKFDMKYNETVRVKGHVDDKKNLVIDKVIDKSKIKPLKEKAVPTFLKEKKVLEEIEERLESIG